MSTFHLQIVTVDGSRFDGEAEAVSVRATTGDVTILAHHADYVAALGMGAAFVVTEGQKRWAAAMGGMLAATGGSVRLIATTFEWADEIDVDRARAALEKAQAQLERPELSGEERAALTAAMRRAQVRLGVAAKRTS